MPHGVLADHLGIDELQQVIRAARLETSPREPVPAERLAPDHRAGRLSVDIEVADGRPPYYVIDSRGVAREKPARQRVFEPVHDVAGGLDARDALYREQRAKYLVLEHRGPGRQSSRKRWRNEPSGLGNRLPPPKQASFAGSTLLVIQNA